MIICILILLKLHFMVYANDSVTFNFIKSFIQNEHKPTILITKYLCWQKYKTVKLSRELSNDNTRLSSDYNEDITYIQDNAILFLVDLDCTQKERVFDKPKLLRAPYRWLVLYNHRNQSRIQQLMDLPILADSDFVVAERNGDNIVLMELHKPSTTGATYSNSRGIYSGKEDDFVDNRPYRELFRRRKDVMGHPLIMSNVIQESNSTQYHLPREDRLEIQYDSIAKISWMHVHIAFQMLNATPRYIFSHRWGYKKDGQWSGMINDIRTGRADLGTNCVALPERLGIVVFTDCIAKFRLQFIFRQPPLSYVSNIFTLPFSINVWIAIAVSLIISSITIWIATKWEVHQLGTNQTQVVGSIGDSVFMTLSALSQQGCSKVPRKLSGRIMLLVVFTALMALYVAYSANIVVLLQAPSKTITNLEQLANSKMTLAALDIDYNYFILKLQSQKDPVRTAIYKKVVPDKGKPQYYSFNEGVERVRQGLFAFHSTIEHVYFRIEQTFLEIEKCDLTEIDFVDSPLPYVPVNKHSPYLELLRVAFKRIRESGIQMAQHKRMHVPKPRCSGKVAAFSSVGLRNVRPVLLFMMYSTVVAVVILIAEILTHKLSIHFAARVNNNVAR